MAMLAVSGRVRLRHDPNRWGRLPAGVKAASCTTHVGQRSCQRGQAPVPTTRSRTRMPARVPCLPVVSCSTSTPLHARLVLAPPTIARWDCAASCDADLLSFCHAHQWCLAPQVSSLTAHELQQAAKTAEALVRKCCLPVAPLACVDVVCPRLCCQSRLDTAQTSINACLNQLVRQWRMACCHHLPQCCPLTACCLLAVPVCVLV